jgi:uncharacterized protein YjdB
MFKRLEKLITKLLIITMICIGLVPNTTVFASTIKVTKITLSDTSLSIAKGNTETLIATVSPSDASNTAVKWSSSNTSVATVNSSGKITALKKGTETITCTAKDGSGKKATCKVTVTKAIEVTKIILNETNLSIAKGDTEALTATVTPTAASNIAVKWTSSNTSVATVNSSGKITAVKKGTATIICTAKDGSGKKANCKVKVTS